VNAGPLAFFADMPVNPFLAGGLAAGLLASVACGVVGPYVVTRRLLFLAGAVAHMAVGGLGAAIFLRYRFPDALSWLEPLQGATAAAVLGAVLLAVIEDRARERLDTLVAALWSVGMAVGILLVKLTPGYHAELMSYLFGNLSLVDGASLRQMLWLDLAVVAVALLFHRRFLAICLDAEQARLQRLSVLATQTVLLVLVALTVVALTRIVGLILVLALLSLPAATAGRLTRRLAPSIPLAIALSALLTTTPRIAVYGTDVSPEAAVVLAAGIVYLLVALLRPAPATAADG
jgi:zinc transport system permease protein